MKSFTRFSILALVALEMAAASAIAQNSKTILIEHSISIASDPISEINVNPFFKFDNIRFVPVAHNDIIRLTFGNQFLGESSQAVQFFQSIATICI